MALVSLSFSVCVLMASLPGAARFSSADENSCPCLEIPQSKSRQEACYTCVQGDMWSLRCKDNYGVAQWTKYLLACTHENSCPCPEIPQRSLTKPPPQTCFQIGGRFRYQCIDGHARKSGTSNLIKCEATGGAPQWTEPTLECIPASIRDVKQNVSILSAGTEERNTTDSTRHDKLSCPCPEHPQRNLTKSPPTACFQISSIYSHTCKEFYMKKMGTSNFMKCRHLEGVPRGTEYRLECIPTSTTEIMPSASASPSVTGEKNSTEAIPHDSVNASTAGAVCTVLRLMIYSLIVTPFIVYKRRLIKNFPVPKAGSVKPGNPGSI